MQLPVDGSEVRHDGGIKTLLVQGALTSATLEVSVDGVVFVPVGEATTFDAPGVANFTLNAGVSLRLTVVGGDGTTKAWLI